MTQSLDCIVTLASATVAGILQVKGKGEGDHNDCHVPHNLQETVIILHGERFSLHIV